MLFNTFFRVEMLIFNGAIVILHLKWESNRHITKDQQEELDELGIL